MLKKYSLAFLSFSVTYVLAEVVFSSLYINRKIYNDAIWFHEAVEQGVSFNYDPVVGYRISSFSSRYGVVLSDGTLATLGMLRGNNLGYPDDRDFHPKKANDSIYRIAVFGDSFTASQFTDRSWLTVFEENLNNNSKDSIELYNFSVDGGGLANWASIIHNRTIPDKWELDGIVFAMLCGDLDRTFHWRQEVEDKCGKREVVMGYFDSWFPEKVPQDTSQLPYLTSGVKWGVFSPSDVNRIENGVWFEERSIKPYFFHKLRGLIMEWLNAIASGVVYEVKAETEFVGSGQLQMVGQLASDCKSIGVPIAVIVLESGQKREQEFAETLGAFYLEDVVDSQIFADYEEKYRIEGDFHWSQAGANAFADRNYNQIRSWLDETVLPDD